MGADHLLLLRFLHFLPAIYVIQEGGKDRYSANNFTKNLIIPNLAAGVKQTFDAQAPATMALPEFLEWTKYENPANSEDCAFNLGHSTKESIFKWLKTRPEKLHDFIVWTSGQREGRANWLDFFPLEQQISNGFGIKDNEVMIVDIGGGCGHEIQAILSSIQLNPAV